MTPCDRLVRLGDRRRQLPRARFGILEEFCQARVDLPATPDVGRLQGTGCEQRVREADLVVVGLEDASLDSRGQAGHTIHAGRLFRDRDCRVSVRGCGDEKVAAFGRQRAQPPMDEIVERIGHRQWPAGLDGCLGTSQRSHDLERVEGVPAGGLVHLGEQRPWQ
jgi:hypothetical protein